jgi:hypothetical protein
MAKALALHHDVLSGEAAARFRNEMGAALMLRQERLRRSRDSSRADPRVTSVENVPFKLGSAGTIADRAIPVMKVWIPGRPLQIGKCRLVGGLK